MFGDRLDLNLVQSLLPTKCAAKQVAFAQIEDFFDQKMILNVRRTWSQWLGPLVPNLPECELVLSDLRDTMKSII